MKRQDYTTQISHYVPNEKKYHFVFPLHILSSYNGASNLDETIDDNLTYHIIEPILNHQIEYNFELIWNNKKENLPEDTLDIYISVNADKFALEIVIDNLTKQQMLAGLQIYKEEYGKLIKIYE